MCTGSMRTDECRRQKTTTKRISVEAILVSHTDRVDQSAKSGLLTPGHFVYGKWLRQQIASRVGLSLGPARMPASQLDKKALKGSPDSDANYFQKSCYARHRHLLPSAADTL